MERSTQFQPSEFSAAVGDTTVAGAAAGLLPALVAACDDEHGGTVGTRDRDGAGDDADGGAALGGALVVRVVVGEE